MNKVAAIAETEASLIAKLQSIQIGGDSSQRIRKKDLICILRNLVTLTANGVSLCHALETLTSDKSLKRYRSILRSLSDAVRNGERFSTGLKRFPQSFSTLIVHQIEVGERAGKLTDSLSRVTGQLEEGSNLKSFLIKKLSYPLLLIVAGIGSVTFMMMCVIPTFQKMYAESNATLPWITEFLIGVSRFVVKRGWIVAISLLVAVILSWYGMIHPYWRKRIDGAILQIPLIGDWFRNIAILQFIDILGNLMDSGFTLVEALPCASLGVRNAYIRDRFSGLHSAIRRGERFSLAIEKENDLFPPVVKQLVVVGERTGRLSETTREIRTHMRRDVERYTTAVLGAIEPILTATLAVVVGGILLAVYLPMFDMIGKTNQ